MQFLGRNFSTCRNTFTFDFLKWAFGLILRAVQAFYHQTGGTSYSIKEDMICHLCKEDKLSKEFPFEPLTENCDHPLLHCLRCATASVKNSKKCSQCETEVNENNAQYQQYMEILDFLFPAADVDSEPENVSSSFGTGDAPSNLVITTLSGDCTTIPYNPNQTIQNLKYTITERLGPLCNKQCLLYQETELKTFDHNNELSRIKDYNVPPNSTIYLIILLYAVPEGLDDVIFDLFWGYPKSGKDYLDASVLLYSGSKCIEVVDYQHTASKSCTAVRHSGDVMDNNKRLGHHTINVSIKSIPSHINKLVFILSAWNSPNISKYPNPSLRFFDAKFPDKQLCSDEMSHALHSQAIIMCCLSKRGGQWQVFSLKTRAGGNAKNYNPLKSRVGSLIQQGCI